MIWIILAFWALIGRWIGDFLIQKSTRKVGNVTALITIVCISFIILSSIIQRNGLLSWEMLQDNFPILIWIGLFSCLSALINFNAFRIGKMSVIAPLMTLEIPITAITAYIVIQQSLSIGQIGGLMILMIGLMMVSYKRKEKNITYKRETGILRWIASGIGFGILNFLVGYGSITVDPFVTLRMIDITIIIVMTIIIGFKGQYRQAYNDITQHIKTLFSAGIFDSLWWLSFAYATTLIPISIVAGISEWYVLLSCIFGMMINKETLQKHQKIGLVMAITAAITLAIITQ